MAKLPKFEDWKAPWELKDEEFDEEAARRYIYNLTSDKDKLQGKVDTLTSERDTAREEVTTAKKDLEAAQASGADAETVTKLQAKVKESEDKAKAAELRATRIEVAADKGIPLAQAKRLQGETREELEADADEFAQSFGSQGNPGDEEDDEDDEDGVPTRTPKRLTNPGDGGRDSGDGGPVDIDKALALIPRL